MMYYNVSYWTGEGWMPSQVMDAEQLEAFIYVLCDEEESEISRHQDLIDAIVNGEEVDGYSSDLITVDFYGEEDDEYEDEE